MRWVLSKQRVTDGSSEMYYSKQPGKAFHFYCFGGRQGIFAFIFVKLDSNLVGK